MSTNWKQFRKIHVFRSNDKFKNLHLSQNSDFTSVVTIIQHSSNMIFFNTRVSNARFNDVTVQLQHLKQLKKVPPSQSEFQFRMFHLKLNATIFTKFDNNWKNRYQFNYFCISETGRLNINTDLLKHFSYTAESPLLRLGL